MHEKVRTLLNNISLTRIIDKHGTEQFHLQGSAMLFHNMGDTYTSYVELTQPFLLAYEAVNHKEGSAKYLEIPAENRIFSKDKINNIDYVVRRALHKHDFYELTYVLSGQLHMNIEGFDMYYTAGEACFCNRNIRHTEVLDSDYEAILFMLKEDFLISLYDEGNFNSENIFRSALMDIVKTNTSETLLISKRLIDFRLLPHKDSSYSDNVLLILNSLIEQFTQSYPGAQYFIKGYMLRFFAMLESSENYQITMHTLPSSKTEALFLEISNYFKQASSRVTREDLRQQFHYSPDYINRIIRQYSGKTLNEYLRDYLMRRACILLVSSEMSVSEICEALGYSNRSFFTRQFREHFGISPLEYRKQNKYDK